MYRIPLGACFWVLGQPGLEDAAQGPAAPEQLTGLQGCPGPRRSGWGGYHGVPPHLRPSLRASLEPGETPLWPSTGAGTFPPLILRLPVDKPHSKGVCPPPPLPAIAGTHLTCFGHLAFEVRGEDRRVLELAQLSSRG